MKILVVGSGAREHALVNALLADPAGHEVVAAPGNGGMAQLVATVALNVNDPEAVAALAVELAADLVIVGPEAPLVAGAADAVRSRGIACFGPSAAAAQLEGSKSFAKEVMAAAAVPTAAAHTCTTIAEVAEALDSFGPPYVVKDDGLAGGKGVVVTTDRDEALAHARRCIGAGSQLVIEEYLDGPEVSLFVIADGTTAVPMLPAQDHKRAGDGDTGPNTGGMGAYTPLAWAPSDLVAEIVARVAQPTIDEMARRGTPFSGVLYCGLALTSKGLRVVEFNARFGDPEIQAVLRLLKSDLAPILLAAAIGQLATIPALEWSRGSASCVVIAAQGYPGDVIQGDDIDGIVAAELLPGVSVVHAGTAFSADRRLVTAGGRVLSVTAIGDDLSQSLSRAYAGVATITIRGSHFRSDIGDHG